MAIHLGDRLGWYRSLAEHGPSTAQELASRTSCSPRYAREWLEQQELSGILLAERTDEPAERRYTIPDGVAEALTDERSLAYIAPLARMAAGAGAQMDALLDAYRTGGGVSWAQFGTEMRESQADLNRPWFERLPETFAGVERVHAVLSRPGARIADVGTGAGFPGLPLAVADPDRRFTLVESTGKKARFVRHAATLLDLPNVEVVEARAESYKPARPFDAVIARALGSLAEFVRVAGHLTGRGGRLLAMKGKVPEDEIAALPAGWKALAVHPVAGPGLDAERCLVELGKV
jgi:16S rRNA (guanine(527)-N(7))-methyltransferase RsmG